MISVSIVLPGCPRQTTTLENSLTCADALLKLFPDKEKRDKMCIVFMGKVIPDDKKLSDVEGLKEAGKVFVQCRPKRNQTIEKVVNQEKLSFCKSSFQKIKKSRVHHHKMVKALNEEGMLERIAKKVPGLMQDVQSHAAIRDMTTIGMILNDDEQTFVKKHPVIIDALSELLSELVPGHDLAPLEEVQSEERLAREHMASVESASAPATAPAPPITSEMLQQAMQQVLRAMSGGGQPVRAMDSPQAPSPTETDHTPESEICVDTDYLMASSPPATAHPAEEQPLSPELFGLQRRELERHGFTDLRENVEVLMETQGDVQQALVLLTTMRASEFES